MLKSVYFRVDGRVQGVMFRQTFIRAAQRRNLTAGASNLPDRGVSCYLSGDAGKVEELLSALRGGATINSWGASVTHLTELSEPQGLPLSAHQVTTHNVDRFAWNANVEMYL